MNSYFKLHLNKKSFSLEVTFLNMIIISWNATISTIISFHVITICHIIGESVSGSPSVVPPSPSTERGGGGGRDERSGLMPRRSGGSGRTRAGWRRRREALNPSQASLSPSAAFTWRKDGLLLETRLLYKYCWERRNDRGWGKLQLAG